MSRNSSQPADSGPLFSLVETDNGRPRVPELAREGQLRAYYTSALTNLADDARRLVQEVGETVFVACEDEDVWCFLPHWFNDPLANPTASAADVYIDDRVHTIEAALLVVYTGFPSWGGGQELEIAAQALCPVLLIGSGQVGTVSRMVRGAPTNLITDAFDFSDLISLRQKLRERIRRLLPEMRGHQELLTRIDSVGLPARVGQLLKNEGITPAELASGLGVSIEYARLLSNSESHTSASNPSLTILLRLADFLVVTIGFLLGQEGVKESDLLRFRIASQRYGVPQEALRAAFARGQARRTMPLPVKLVSEIAATYSSAHSG